MRGKNDVGTATKSLSSGKVLIPDRKHRYHLPSMKHPCSETGKGSYFSLSHFSFSTAEDGGATGTAVIDIASLPRETILSFATGGIEATEEGAASEEAGAHSAVGLGGVGFLG